jgi:hypothetical protein
MLVLTSQSNAPRGADRIVAAQRLRALIAHIMRARLLPI